MTHAEIKNYYEFAPTSGSAPKQLIVMLHGVGSNGQDLITLAPFMAGYVPDAQFISPDAPYVYDMAPPDYPNSFQWFSLQSRDPHDMLKGVTDTKPLVDDFLDGLLDKYNLTADKLALVGFSQGTMTSLYVGPRYKDKIAGILGYSGALIGGDELGNFAHKPPVCLIHGEADNVVPVQMRDFAQAQLEEAGYNVSGHTTPKLQHGIDQDGILVGGKFLKTVFV